MTNRDPENRAMPSTGSVRYMDGSALLRSQTIKGPALIVAAGIVAISVALGGFALTNVADRVVFAAAHEKAAIEQILTQPVTDDTPRLSTFVMMKDEDARAHVGEQVKNLYDVPRNDGAKTLDVIKLADGVNGDTASSLYVSSSTKMKADTAVKVLHGTWRYDVDRSSGVVERVRFADFTSGSPDAAVRAAMAQQGFPEESVAESGLDDSGNTFRAGVATTESGDEFNWRISAINLTEVFSIAGLPENAVYVGVKVSR